MVVFILKNYLVKPKDSFPLSAGLPNQNYPGTYEYRHTQKN
jgi:hypothetical protein